MNILVLNSGSSSLKYQLINMENSEALVEGICERIGINGSSVTYKVPVRGIKEKMSLDFPSHKEAISRVLELLQDEKIGVIKSLEEIEGIGHRVVHGADLFNKSVLVTNEVIEKLKEVSSLAPLHNPANLLGIEICQNLMSTKKNVAVFDTAFHQTMPEEAFMYALPYDDYEELRVRKYGFHGTSHKYVSNIAKNILNREDSKIIVCHLGNGSSVSAVKGGKCIDTSMGLTPLEGLMMGTRCGDIDPAAVIYVAKERGLSFEEMDKRMNKESGILGIFGNTSDFRDVKEAYDSGNERAKLTIDMLTYKIKSYVSQYAGILGGVDALCFTGGIGENSELVREKVCEGLSFMGIELSLENNNNFRNLANDEGIADITGVNSKAKVLVIPTNEELVIAQDTYKLIK